jgi:CheY-like chemotaxis protein
MTSPLPTILVVDDEPGIRTMIQFELSQQGYDILTAESGAKALEILNGRTVNLILTDMRMPQMDGLELVSRVRQILPTIPIVLMTGFVEERVRKVQEQKVSGTLNKPFTIDQLAEMVHKVLGG